MRVDDVLTELKPEHFTSGKVPSRTTVSDRLAGIGLKTDFVEAIADICSNDATIRERLLAQVRSLHKRAATSELRKEKSDSQGHGEVSDGAALTRELVTVQRRSLQISDKLMRALERAQELEWERGSANQMVLLLLAMVDKLQRDIAALARERDHLQTSPALPQTSLDHVRTQLAKSEQQRATAESELERARAERHKADRLAEDAAAQVRALTEELDRLRAQAPNLNTGTSPVSTPPSILEEPLDTTSSIDQALAKAARHLDDRAGRLDHLADELYLDNSPDNSVTSEEELDMSLPPVNVSNTVQVLRVDNGTLSDAIKLGTGDDTGPRVLQQRTASASEEDAVRPASFSATPVAAGAMASRRLNVLVLDDNAVIALASINAFVANLPGDSGRFHFSSLANPAGLEIHLDAHPEIDVVLSDVTFERSETNRELTCLSALDILIRRNGPKVIGCSRPQVNATLFPFAVCQLFPPSQEQVVVGWTYKDDHPEYGYPKMIRILDAISSNQRLPRPDTLLSYMARGNGSTGGFIRTILASRADVELWQLMSITHQSAKDLATAARMSSSAIHTRLDRYFHAILEFEFTMEKDGIFPFGGSDFLNLPRRSPGDVPHPAPRRLVIETFAQIHQNFFQAPELPGLVKQREISPAPLKKRRLRDR
ncbi:hypothetical protein OG906_42900 (plasmid) [Streptomyces sp. NBC_01426]|uniref:hypothetical protein n=1 Tax=Streptomyces sp. NBC_01426 TaxID=2975866 RepID=UPI002E331DE9|nr:hypothetical protein [Streptomyces sp. NBC_01426]